MQYPASRRSKSAPTMLSSVGELLVLFNSIPILPVQAAEARPAARPMVRTTLINMLLLLDWSE
jgi:hypothetical protein